MLDSVGNRFIFPAPDPSYGAQSYKKNLCWIPWNSVISPKRVGDEKSGDGIPCLWFPAPKAANVILFFHANAEDLGMNFALLKHMRDQFKVNVLAVEYPGYGLLSALTPSEHALYEVALTVFRFLVNEINVRYSQIILFGRSLGSGPAVFLAAQYPVGGLILVSAFSSIRAAVQSIVGRVFAWTCAERFPNSKIIANVSCSTLFIHGECDDLIPAEHSLRLFNRCRARKLLITPPRMEHNSNLFGDTSFLTVPAVHFFGFPGYLTSTPPRLPAHLFESPERRLRMKEKEASKNVPLVKPWLCDCLNKRDCLGKRFCRQEHSEEEITIQCFDSVGECASKGSPNGKPERVQDEAPDGTDGEEVEPESEGKRRTPSGLKPVGPYVRSKDQDPNSPEAQALPSRASGGQLEKEPQPSDDERSSFSVDEASAGGGGYGAPGVECPRYTPSRLRKDVPSAPKAVNDFPGDQSCLNFESLAGA